MHLTSAHLQFLDGKVHVCVADLTTQDVDAVVNAANSTLLGGGGVDGAIHRQGGQDILAACRHLRATAWPDGLPTGEIAITPGGALPARYVIHTVGPIYGRHDGREAELLAACYLNALALAERLNLRTIAFPAISTGIYGFPPQEAAQVVSLALNTAVPGLHSLDEVRLVFFNEEQLKIFVAHQKFSH